MSKSKWPQALKQPDISPQGDKVSILSHLTQDEHDFLTSYVARGHKKARYLNRARALLLSHEGKEDQEIAKLLGITRTTDYHIRKKYHRQSYEHLVEVINDQPRVGRPVVFNYQVEANVSMIACSEAPQG